MFFWNCILVASWLRTLSRGSFLGHLMRDLKDLGSLSPPGPVKIYDPMIVRSPLGGVLALHLPDL